jgi:HSP20 family protein
MVGFYAPAFSGAAGRWFDPVRQIRQIQNDLGRTMGNLGIPAPPEFPLMNVWAGADGAVVMAEVPGVSPDSLDIAIHQNTVTLRGERPPEQLPEGAVVHRQERVTGQFTRNVILPYRVDGDKASAKFGNGVLRLELPRPDSDKPHHVKVIRE